MSYVMKTTMPQVRGKGTSRWLALGAVAGPVLFIAASFGLAPTHTGYSAISQPVSALAIGPNGELMRAVFLLYGVLVTIGVIAVFQGLEDELGAVTRWVCAVLLVISPLGLLWAGILTMDHLALHNDGMQAAIATPVITLPVVGLILRRAPSWRRFGTLMLLGGPLTLALLVGFINSAPHAEVITGAGGGTYGLWQRALGIEVEAWFVAMGWLAFRTKKR
jgi:hypothetical protein